ncbi:hypothetical protein F8M41_009835 [Gigaspora margarita]|uniref:Uncharacterized protein n=1 Tax=Gigaspora margarita TaxID=4874 RepID=A0A8H4EQL8_GIGMA|nr:hypothetical protein F8M41_009835 [Gigaspora margarita]
MGGIPVQLGLNRDETKAYNNMTAPETFVFNALPDNNAKIVYVRALVDRDRNWRESSLFRLFGRFLTYLFRRFLGH